MNEERPVWDWEFATESFPRILEAFFQYTLGITAASAAIAIVLGLAFVLLRRARRKVVSWPTAFVIEFVRSTPIPIQLFFVYIGISLGTEIRLSALTSGILVLGVHYACYMSEVYRAGVEAIPKGQWEACTALSLSPVRTWQRVVLPQVIRRVLPSMGNQIIALFKETPFLIVISVAEMVTVARDIGNETFRFTEPIVIAGLIFLAASYPTAVLMRKLEIRLGH